MTSVDLPPPILRADVTSEIDVEQLRRDLEASVDGEVRFDTGSRGAYSTDSSNYRQIPIGVVVPRTVEAGAEAVRVCAAHRAPLLSRGGGTSLAGEATNTAVVIDWSKYCTGLLSVDAERRTCVVEPGIVLDRLNDLLRPYDLEYGPEPATHDHCTLGGMIGNNSCGATAQRTGKVVDNIERLEVLLYDGTRMWVGPTSEEDYQGILDQGGRRAEIYQSLHRLRDHYLADVRTGYPKIPRRVSGYNLDSLLPENGFDVARALVGSESTLVTVLRAELRLVPRLRSTAMVLLAYPDVATAADDVPAILGTEPVQLEGIDSRVIAVERDKGLNRSGMRFFPEGHGFLILVYGDAEDGARSTAEQALDRLGRSVDDEDVQLVVDQDEQSAVFKVREAALGVAARGDRIPDSWAGWEDSAVAPERLGDYLRDLRALFDRYDYTTASFYGHFGQGCVHTRVPFDLVTADGVRAFRSFMNDAADLVVSYGGSLSGEHGDGQARGELLPKMFGSALFRAFREFKAVFDPGLRMNPGKVVPARPLDDDLRLGVDYDHPAPKTHFRYPDDDGSFSRAVQRCVGVGKCRHESGGVMCPSYMVTREEEHSTRGRARLLFEMLDGTARGGPIADGWRSEEVRDALDLCLACKGCKSDCPVNVDMATYKAEFLSHHYAGRLRPRSHYSMGWLPLLAVPASFAPGALNALTHAPGLSQWVARAGGIDPRRTVPAFALQSLQKWYAGRGPRGTGHRGDVLLWPDTFTNRLQPWVGRAAVEVLEDAGWRVVLPARPVCCGLTWISTGQLATAKRVLHRTLRQLRPHLRAGTPIVGLEPSCTAVFRSDASELVSGEDVERLQHQTLTLSELLMERTEGWQPPRVDVDVLRQTHCHQHAVMGTGADDALLERIGARQQPLDSGCCGLAGNFGFEAGHYDVSMAAAERVLLPAVRAADDDVVLLADGFSCRTQIEQGDSAGREARHLAELLAGALHGNRPRANREESR
ncbi:MAG TPA: FAD-linked oxidase C-terminal domain-containing protein [Nocardioidaceae bacterium]|nr:FAD-linked oxidase C-terminal domain-containing protein [Nocardioidaceae bacterium]